MKMNLLNTWRAEVSVTQRKLSWKRCFCALLMSAYPLIAFGQTSTMYFVHSDHLGTPQKVSNDTGAVVWAADYEPYGPISLQIWHISNTARFPGQVFDAETGLHYNYFRDYDPSVGRYVQSDTIGLAGGINTFAYVYGNPLRYTDPTGEIVHIFLGFGIGAIAGAIAALNDPCADLTDILVGAGVGGLLGGAAAAVPIGGALGGAIIRGGLAGAAGNAAGQLLGIVRGSSAEFNLDQVAVQGAVGAASGGIGNVSGLTHALTSVRAGVNAERAIEISYGVGTTAAIGAGIAAIAVSPSNVGGLQAMQSEPRCSCE